MLFSCYHSLLSFLLIWGSFDQAKPWTFKNTTEWDDISPTCSTGQNQSPVDLRSSILGQNYGKEALELLNYSELAQRMEIKNTGHAVQLSGSWGTNKPSITGAVLSREVYTISDVHLHWGTHDLNGTEHTIEGKQYAAELHFVHLNRKYRKMSEAMLHPDGLAVVAVLYKVDNNVHPDPGMAQLAELTKQVLSVNATARVAPLNLASFLPKPLLPLFSYFGSLTTPPCTENVRWIVLSKPQPITSDIIGVFRNVMFIGGDTHNIRPLQPINNRLIEYYTH